MTHRTGNPKPQFGKEAEGLFLDLCCALRLGPRDLVGSVFIYCDESGVHLDSEIAVIAGYISTVEEWCVFVRQWQHILNRFRVPYIHMAELEHRKKASPYAGWSTQKREQLLKRARKIIHGRTSAGFAAVVRRRDFLSVLPKDMRDYLGGPYGWCAHTLLNQVNEWRQTQGLSESVSWIFEKGRDPSETKQVNALFAELSVDSESGIKNWTFSDGDLPPLQSADLLAYEVYRETVHQYAKGIVKPTNFHRREGRALVRKDADFPNLEIWTEESLSFWLKSLPEHARRVFRP